MGKYVFFSGFWKANPRTFGKFGISSSGSEEVFESSPSFFRFRIHSTTPPREESASRLIFQTPKSHKDSDIARQKRKKNRATRSALLRGAASAAGPPRWRPYVALLVSGFFFSPISQAILVTSGALGQRGHGTEPSVSWGHGLWGTWANCKRDVSS